MHIVLVIPPFCSIQHSPLRLSISPFLSKHIHHSLKFSFSILPFILPSTVSHIKLSHHSMCHNLFFCHCLTAVKSLLKKIKGSTVCTMLDHAFTHCFLAGLFIPTPSRLVWEAFSFSHAAYIEQRLFKAPKLIIGRKCKVCSRYKAALYYQCISFIALD